MAGDETCRCGSTRIEYADGSRRAIGPVHFGPGGNWPCLLCREWVGAATIERTDYSKADLDAAVRDAVAAKDAAYTERNQCVAAIARMAVMLGWPAGIGQHDPNDATWDPEWRTIVYVDLPTGQASWHVHDSQRALFEGLPTYARPWDGHTTPEKYERLANIAARAGQQEKGST